MKEKFDSIRFFHPEEVNPAIRFIMRHPMMKLLLHYSLPNISDEEVQKIVGDIHSIEDFQKFIIYPSIKNVLKASSDGFTISGAENLNKNESYLFISNHRDILLDTCLLNFALLEKGLNLTASVIGDNLVQRDLYLILAKLNRNFFVKRSAAPRELLENSKLLSEYIFQLLTSENRSVWIAQREGRAKDGNDFTQPAVLKMISMFDAQSKPCQYFKKLKVVPVSISYELDPTDKLKVEKMCADDLNQEKHKNEDFLNIMTGVSGQKKRIHLHFGNIEDEIYTDIENSVSNSNKQIQKLAEVLTKKIIEGYKLWPSNYIAADLLKSSTLYSKYYTEKEKQFFIKRMNLSIVKSNLGLNQALLEMYANPVFNKRNL